MKGDFVSKKIFLFTFLLLGNRLPAVDLELFKQAIPAKAFSSVEKPYHPENHQDWRTQLPFLENLFCGIKFYDGGKKYRLKTFSSLQKLKNLSYQVTHKGACGVCSSLQDLVVYLEKPDLTSPVRKCGSLSVLPGATKLCLKNIGFSESCSQIWYDNIIHTRKKCKWICLKSWMRNKPFNNPDGSLNSCLQCDEDHSGPVFKAVAGRTRRNSGIISAITRHGSEVYPVSHDYSMPLQCH